MPITKQAIKKMRRDEKAREKNNKKRALIKQTIKVYKRSPSTSLLQKIYSLIDKAVKTHLMHKNKGSRLKSRLSKHIS